MAEEYRGPYGITQRPKRKIGEIGQGILGGIEAGGDFLQYLTDPFSGLPKDASDFVIDYLMSPSEYQKQILESEREKDAVAADAFRAKEADLTGTIGADPNLNLEEISNLIASASGAKVKKDVEKASPIIRKEVSPQEFRAREAQMAGKLGTNELDKAFIAALQDVEEARGDKPPKGESKEDALARYKKEFEEATGIDASGKVDKSRALMAFGLALMQNKAGKGFNVGKMLQSVGEAGEAAMPQLDKAISRAEASKLAAGKYALEQIAADKSASAALAKEDIEFQRERLLKEMEILSDIEKEKIKAGKKGTEVKGSYFDEPIQGLKIRRGRTASGPVFENPTNALDKVTRALQNTNSAISTVDEMIDLASEIDSADSSTFEIAKDRFNTILVGAGLANPNVVFGESGIGKEQQVNALQDSIIAEFKRLLTQETGNGISNDDIVRIQALLGKINLFGNTKESILRLNEIKQIFSRKRTNVRDVIDQLRDPSFYPTELEYEKNMERLPSLLGGEGTQYKTITSEQGIPRVQVKD